MRLKFAANLSWLYTELPFLGRFEAAARDGFQGVECLFPHEHGVHAVAQRLQALGLDLVLFNAAAGDWAGGERGLASVAGREAAFRTALEQALEDAAVLNCPRVHVMAGLLPATATHRERQAAWERYEGHLRWAAPLAEAAGRTLTIEPLNPRDTPGYLLTHQSQAHDLVTKVGSPALKVQLDLYHRQIVEGDVIRHLQSVLPTGRVAHLQIAGVPDRGEPDQGELCHGAVFDTLRTLGWSGWIGCEYRPRQAGPGGTRAGLGWWRDLAHTPP